MLMVDVLLERLETLTCRNQTRFLTCCKINQHRAQDKAKEMQDKDVECVDRKHKKLPYLFYQRDVIYALSSIKNKNEHQ